MQRGKMLENTSDARQKMFKTFLKFMAVGILNGIIYFSLMYLFTSVIGLWYMVSALISVVIQTLITYSLHRIWTWKSKKAEIKSAINIYRFAKYIIVGLGGLLLGLGLLYMITEVWHIHYMISVFISSCILLVLNFGANYLWTWGNNETKELKWVINLVERMGFLPIIKRLGVQI
jgi:dolichol-phosphate mannosyltransferase